MYILVFDTTGPVGSAAVLDTESGQIAMKETREAMSHLRRLAALTQELLQEQNLRPADLSAVAASIGPGSYTGIRIGVSTARAFAQGADLPCVAVPTLDMFRLYADGTRPVCVIFNARRGQVYGAVYDQNGADILAPGPYMLTDVLEVVQKHGLDPVFYGDGIDAYGDQLEGYTLALEEDRYQTAALAARYAQLALQEGKTCAVSELKPDYMRKTEAEQKLADGSLARARAAKMAKFRSR